MLRAIFECCQLIKLAGIRIP